MTPLPQYFVLNSNQVWILLGLEKQGYFSLESAARVHQFKLFHNNEKDIKLHSIAAHLRKLTKRLNPTFEAH